MNMAAKRMSQPCLSNLLIQHTTHYRRCITHGKNRRNKRSHHANGEAERPMVSGHHPGRTPRVISRSAPSTAGEQSARRCRKGPTEAYPMEESAALSQVSAELCSAPGERWP